MMFLRACRSEEGRNDGDQQRWLILLGKKSRDHKNKVLLLKSICGLHTRVSQVKSTKAALHKQNSFATEKKDDKNSKNASGKKAFSECGLILRGGERSNKCKCRMPSKKKPR